LLALGALNKRETQFRGNSGLPRIRKGLLGAKAIYKAPKLDNRRAVYSGNNRLCCFNRPLGYFFFGGGGCGGFEGFDGAPLRAGLGSPSCAIGF
jgi:hypothetical protein